MSRGKQISGSQIELIHRLFRDGYSYVYIAEVVGCCKETVVRYTKPIKRGRKPRSSYTVDKIRERQMDYNANGKMYNLQNELLSLELELNEIAAKIAFIHKHLGGGEK